MKKTLLFIALIACSSLFAQTELVKNGTCDEHGTGSDTSNTSDNADAWDMTPNSTLNGGIVSPYRFDTDDNPNGWYNSALETALEIKYLGAEGSLDEQPGSTSSGNNGTRGVKLYDDGSPSISGSSRRLYQRVVGLTIGETYNFSIDSRSEAENTPSEVYILNTQIQNEDGIDANKYSDASVTAGMDIVVASANVGNWETKTLSFVATTTEVVIYVRSLFSVDQSTEVFYDNISLKQAPAATGNVVSPVTTALSNGYVNAFSVADDSYQFGFAYGLADMKTTVTASSVTLQPNFAIWTAEAANTAWFDNSSGTQTPVVYIEANSFVESTDLDGSALTFEGNVSSFDIDGAYTVKAFIKALNPNNGFSTDVNNTVTLSATGDFSVSATAAELADGLIIQYGFSVTGVPADPANEGTLGSVVVGAKATASTTDVTISDFRMYPNPTTNLLNISSDTTIDKATVFNLLGQQVKTVDVNNSKTELNVCDLESGIYLVKITSGSKQISKKFIKE